MKSPQISQNRTTMVVSAQPSNSKWCCSGAIRNTRRPVSLNEPTWIATDSVMITNSPPRIASSSWVRVQMARPTRTPPSASDPVSPLNLVDGGAFHHRKPKHAPITAAATTARSSGSRMS